MLSKVCSAATLGIDAVRITVEVDSHGAGQPGFQMVGLADLAVREAYARVKAALANSGFFFPNRHIVVNLSPADVRKEGSAFDLPIAIGILHATENLRLEDVVDRVFVGELSLDGSVTAVRGALSISSAVSKDRSIRELIVPAANANEAAAVEGVRVIGAANLPCLLAHLRGDTPIAPATTVLTPAPPRELVDFSDVRGQAMAKRALEVAAAGGHNVMMIGPPGSGKTMLAKRLPSILPRLTVEESIMTTKIHSVAGTLPPASGLLVRRPFRAPHHTISTAGLAGGGRGPRPGEVSLAHHGVLFLDELTEFRRETLEALRQPVEDGIVTIARANRTVSFPAQFVMACALNPCPCGHFNDARRECLCTSSQIARYLSKISGPLLDRIDLQVEVAALSTDEVTSLEPGEPSSAIRDRVETARAIQRDRFRGARVTCNAEMTTRHLRKFCELSAPSRQLLTQAIDRLALSARAHDRILKVSRTIADLAGSERIESAHLAESVQYRALDRAYFQTG